MTPFTRLNGVRLLLTVLLLAAGCGGDGGGEGAAPAETPAGPAGGPAGAPAPDPAPDTATEPADGEVGGPITLGLLTSLTSDLAATGIYTKNGFDMAVADINADGGVAGRELVVVEEDTADSNTVAVNALQLLLEQDPVAIMGPIWGTQNLAMSPIIAEAGVPHMYSSGTVEVSEQGNEWLFGIHPSDEIAAEAIARFAVEELGLQRIALQHLNNEYGINAASIITDTVGATDSEVVSVESHGASDTDMSAQLQNHVQADPDGLIAWAFPTDMAVIMRQTQELQFPGEYLGATATVLPATLELVTDDQALGWYGETAAVLVGNEDPEVQEWVERFRERFDRDPNAFDAIAYDGGQMMAMALEEVLNEIPDADLQQLREGVRDALADTTYEGIDTTYDFDEEGRGPHAFTIVEIVEEKGVQAVVEIEAQE